MFYYLNFIGSSKASLQTTLTVIIVVELHGEVDIVRKGVQVLHKQEELPDEQHRGSLGVLQCHLHLHVIVSAVSELYHCQINWKLDKMCATRYSQANLSMSISGPFSVYLNLNW